MNKKWRLSIFSRFRYATVSLHVYYEVYVKFITQAASIAKKYKSERKATAVWASVCLSIQSFSDSG